MREDAFVNMAVTEILKELPGGRNIAHICRRRDTWVEVELWSKSQKERKERIRIIPRRIVFLARNTDDFRVNPDATMMFDDFINDFKELIEFVVGLEVKRAITRAYTNVAILASKIRAQEVAERSVGSVSTPDGEVRGPVSLAWDGKVKVKV